MPNFLNLADFPPPTGLQILAIFINFFFPAVALVVVGTRAAGRLATNQFGLDDWLVSVAMFLSVAETVVSYFFIKTNFIGIHFADIPVHDPTEGLIWAYAVQILYNPILALVKSSVLIFLLRLFGQKNGVRRFIVWLNVANVAQMVGIFFAITFQCFPVAFNWDLTIRNGRCVNRSILYTSTAALNIVTDLLILSLPLWIFVDLKIPRRSKIGLLLVFLLGFIVTIVSIVRLVVLVQGAFGLLTLSDPTFNIGFSTSAIETNLAIITASAPALRPFFRTKERGGWFPRLSLAPSKVEDPEMGQKSVGWEKEPLPVGSGVGGKYGRGGSRGGRRGSGRSGKSGRGGKRPIIRVWMERDVAELRSQSPRSSEEEAMTSDGIMRVSDIQREIDGIVKEIAVTGSGTYTGAPTINSTRDGPSWASRETSRDATPAWPITDAFTERSGDVRRYPQRNYAESVYSVDMRERDYNEERISKYGDKRNAFYNATRGNQSMSRNLTRSNPNLTSRPSVTWKDTQTGKPF